MAKIYGPPTEIPIPHFDPDKSTKDYFAAENRYIAAVREWAKTNGSGPEAGKLIRFQVADGYALYVVLSLRPVKLLHLSLGDGYRFHLDNHLTAAAVREEIRCQKAWDRFLKRAAAKKGATA